MKTQFQVGDRCLVVGVQNGLREAVGRVGTVVRVYRDQTTLQFDERFSYRLHSSNGFDSTSRCWHFTNDKIEPAPLALLSAEAVSSLL